MKNRRQAELNLRDIAARIVAQEAKLERMRSAHLELEREAYAARARLNQAENDGAFGAKLLRCQEQARIAYTEEGESLRSVERARAELDRLREEETSAAARLRLARSAELRQWRREVRAITEEVQRRGK